MLIHYNYGKSFVLLASATFNDANYTFDANLNYIFSELPRVYDTN